VKLSCVSKVSELGVCEQSDSERHVCERHVCEQECLTQVSALAMSMCMHACAPARPRRMHMFISYVHVLALYTASRVVFWGCDNLVVGGSR
jgi:hypothetical protein